MRPRIAFALGALGLVLFEAANVYFVMPFPGSQRFDSLDLAYALYRWRWPIRALFGVLMLAGLWDAWRASKRWRMGVAAAAVAVGGVAYATNFVMAADHMFLQPRTLILKPAAENQVPQERLVVGVEVNGEARAYPMMFLGYHHQVRDSVGGKDVPVTYCTVCRTGRVFSPLVDGKLERFRLVGMDTFNAMLEDESTGSWWRQATGAAVTGPRKGARLAVVPSRQVTLREWLAEHPASLVMQADPASTEGYPKNDDYEKGASRKPLTGTSPESWQEKSWVVGIEIGAHSKAYDWNRLRREHVINDAVGETPIVIVLAKDGVSFFAFERPDALTKFTLEGETLASAAGSYSLMGAGPAGTLRAVAASQEFWHSWRSFHPGTERY
jgi:Protein of unknown function (DUF3179)